MKRVLLLIQTLYKLKEVNVFELITREKYVFVKEVNLLNANRWACVLKFLLKNRVCNGKTIWKYGLKSVIK